MTTRIGERVRVRFAKQGSLRFISHIDLMRCWDRLVRRAELPVRYSEGFHPKARFRWPLALGVGVVGLDEVVEFELREPLAAETVRARLEAAADAGLQIAAVTIHPRTAPCTVVAVEYACRPPAQPQLAQRCAEFLAADTWPVVRHTPGKPSRNFDLRPLVANLQTADGVVRFRLPVTAAGAARPDEVLAAIGIDLRQAGVIERTKVELAEA
jgi:radical SAM-linked protein